jgi:hypothetical protein
LEDLGLLIVKNQMFAQAICEKCIVNVFYQPFLSSNGVFKKLFLKKCCLNWWKNGWSHVNRSQSKCNTYFVSKILGQNVI